MRGCSDDAPPSNLPREGRKRVCAVVSRADAIPLDAARYGELEEAHIDRVRQAQQGGPARSPARSAPLEPSIVVTGYYVFGIIAEGGFAAATRGVRPRAQIENHREGWSQNRCVRGVTGYFHE